VVIVFTRGVGACIGFQVKPAKGTKGTGLFCLVRDDTEVGLVYCLVRDATGVGLVSENASSALEVTC
jgi:hypothetical protein